jgi:hypothetical protein
MTQGSTGSSTNPFEPTPALASQASAPNVLAANAGNPFLTGDNLDRPLVITQRRSVPLPGDADAVLAPSLNNQPAAAQTKSLLDMSLDELAISKQASLPLLAPTIERTPTETSEPPLESPPLELVDSREKIVFGSASSDLPASVQPELDERLLEARRRFTESAQRFAEAKETERVLREHLKVGRLL